MYKNREMLVMELDETRAERDAAMTHAKEVELRIAELQDKLDKVDKNQKLYDDCFEVAIQMKTIQKAFIEAGFDEEQSFKIIMHMLPGGNQAPTLGNVLGAIFD